MDIGAFQRMINDRYGTRDRQRGTPATFMWLIEEVGELARQAGNDAANKEEEFADVLAWLFTLANINDVDMEKAIQKYTSNRIEGFK